MLIKKGAQKLYLAVWRPSIPGAVLDKRVAETAVPRAVQHVIPKPPKFFAAAVARREIERSA